MCGKTNHLGVQPVWSRFLNMDMNNMKYTSNPYSTVVEPKLMISYTNLDSHITSGTIFWQYFIIWYHFNSILKVMTILVIQGSTLTELGCLCYSLWLYQDLSWKSSSENITFSTHITVSTSLQVNNDLGVLYSFKEHLLHVGWAIYNIHLLLNH